MVVINRGRNVYTMVGRAVGKWHIHDGLTDGPTAKVTRHNERREGDAAAAKI